MASNHEDTLQGSSVKILATNSTKLVEWLSSDRHILQHARSDGIIDERVYNRLMSTAQPEDACIQLIDTMIKRGEGTSSQFLKLLKKTEILNTYPQLKQWNSSSALPGPPEPKITNSLSVPGASPAQTMTKTQEDRFAEEKLRSGRSVFIQRVSKANLDQLLDDLLLKKVINEGEMESVRGEKLRSEKARELIDMVRKKGNTACSEMIDIVCQLDPKLGELLHQPPPADQTDRPTTHNNGFTGAGSTQKPPEMTVAEPRGNNITPQKPDAAKNPKAAEESPKRVKKPAAKKPAVKKPAAKKPAADKPAVKKPAAKKPAAQNNKKVTKIPKKTTKEPKAAKKAPAKKKAQPKPVKPRKATSKKK